MENLNDTILAEGYWMFMSLKKKNILITLLNKQFHFLLLMSEFPNENFIKDFDKHSYTNWTEIQMTIPK